MEESYGTYVDDEYCDNHDYDDTDDNTDHDTYDDNDHEQDSYTAAGAAPYMAGPGPGPGWRTALLHSAPSLASPPTLSAPPKPPPNVPPPGVGVKVPKKNGQKTLKKPSGAPENIEKPLKNRPKP